MEIQDKLTARQVAMHMATDIFCAIESQYGYDIDAHKKYAKELYDWIVGKSELPEVYNSNEQTDKLMDMLMNAREDFKSSPLWFPITRDGDGKPLQVIMDAMRDNTPIYIHDSKHTIVIGSKEEFDRRKQEIIDNADYTHYRFIFGDDATYPIDRSLTWEV